MSHERIGRPTSNLVKIISKRNATSDFIFKKIRSERPEIEIWQIFDLYSEKNSQKLCRMIAKYLPSFRKYGSLNPAAVS